MGRLRNLFTFAVIAIPVFFNYIGWVEEKSEKHQKANLPHSFYNFQHLQINYKIYKSDTRNIKGLVFMTHSFPWHSGHFDELGEKLAKQGFIAFAHDAQGWGKSGGDRGYVENPQHFVDDLLQLTEIQSSKYKNIPQFLLGDSMGSLVSVVCAQKRPHIFKGVILLSPVFQIDQILPDFVPKIVSFVSSYAPKFPFFPLGNSYILTRDENSLKKWENDKFANTEFFGRARTMFALYELADEVRRITSTIKWPFLILTGGADPLVPNEGVENFHNNTRTTDKTVKLYDQALHSLLDEPEKNEVQNEIVSWLIERSKQ